MDRSLLEETLLMFQQQRIRIDGFITQVQQALGGGEIPATINPKRGRPAKTITAIAPQAAPPRSHHKQRTMSAAGRERIRQATLARWAKFRAEKEKHQKKLAAVAKKSKPAAA